MKPSRFAAASAAERRSADLFFADLMGRQAVPRRGASPGRLEADRFFSELAGEPAHGTRGSADSEQWGESDPCELDPNEVIETWITLAELKKLIKADRMEIDRNPLVIEVQILKQLLDVVKMAKTVPVEVWREIWKELEAFAACDVKPLVARVKKGEKHANAVLRVLHGLTSILQGYVHDRIDAGFKSRLDREKGWGKTAAKLLIRIIKKQVPVIQREIKANNFAAVAKAFEDFKSDLAGNGFSVTGILNVVVALAKEIIGNAIEDAAKGALRLAAKQLGKRLLGSAAGAASAIFVLEDLYYFVHAMAHISSHKRKLWAYNAVLLRFLKEARRCIAAQAGEKYSTIVAWKRPVAHLDCQVVLHSFTPVIPGKPGEGKWHTAPVPATLDWNTSKSNIVGIDVPASERHGNRILYFQVPPVAKWPARGDSFLAVEATPIDAAGNVGEERSMFIAPCVP